MTDDFYKAHPLPWSIETEPDTVRPYRIRDRDGNTVLQATWASATPHGVARDAAIGRTANARLL